MLRAAVIIMLVATAIGTLMPSGQSQSAVADEQAIVSTDNIVAAQQVSGVEGVTLEREDDGHFYANVDVNGTAVRFLVDTGASTIALAERDAESARVTFSPAEFEVIGKGASGDVMGQQVRLDRVRLGAKEALDVAAVVLDGSQHSLLGQSFLRQFRSVTIEGDRMVLR